MQCEKCKAGEMAATAVRRLSSGLVVIGYVLLTMGVLGMGTAGCVAVVGMSSSASVSEESKRQNDEWALEQLGEAGVSSETLREFRLNGNLHETTIASIEDEDRRRRVEAIISTHSSSAAGSAMGAGIATGIGTAFVLGVGLVSLPLFIVGLLLTLKKNVWRCGACGYVFDRA